MRPLAGSLRHRLPLLVVLVLIALVAGLILADQPAGAARAQTGPGTALPPAPELRRAPPPETAPYEAPPERGGFLPPEVDLAHLDGEWAGPDAPGLAARFDWRTSGKVSPVKNQASCNSCYAFASVAGFESKLLLDGAGLLDLSENNAKECTHNARGCNPGNSQEVFNLWTQRGTVLESCDPYVASDVACKTTCPYQQTALDWRLISGNTVPPAASLKNYIATYGPVHAALYIGAGNNAWQTEFNDYNGSYTLYYAGTQTTNHSVLIVGWDDNLTHAGGSGAWIVKNSWGTGWGGTAGYGSERGYFTIAYGSASIGKYASFLHSWQPRDPTGQLLYYDEGGFTTSYGYGATTAWGLAKYYPTADSNAVRIEFWTTDLTTDVDVYLYDSFNGSALSGLLASKLNLSYGEVGYHSVALDTPVRLTAGNDVVAVVKFTNQSYAYPIPADSTGPIMSGRTYGSYNGADWEDLGGESVDVAIRIRTALHAAPATATVTRTPTLTATRGPSPTPTVTKTRMPKRVELPLLLKGPAAVATPTATRTRTATPTRTTTPQQPAGIYGRLTKAGAPAANIPLLLRYWNGQSWSSAKSTTTGADGRYRFTNVATLGQGQQYYVRFGPNTTNSGLLCDWLGPTITSYTAGTARHGGDFDIANVVLRSPAPNSTLHVPIDFAWDRRGIAGDTYALVFFDLDTGTAWVSQNLGDVGSVRVTNLPAEIQYGKQYGWYVRVYAGAGNYGNSYYYRGITFTASAAAEGVPRESPLAWSPDALPDELAPQPASRRE